MAEYADFEEQLRMEEKEKSKETAKKTRKDEDGTVYEFDEEKKAWFPKIDEYFIANYQINYGETPAQLTNTINTSINEFLAKKPDDIQSEEYRLWYEEYCRMYQKQQAELASNEEKVAEELNKFLKNKNEDEEEENEKEKKVEKTEKDEEKIAKAKILAKEKAKRKIVEPAWCQVDDSKNTNVYVCGLSELTTEEDFIEFMSKVGLLAVDPITKAHKVKLYKGADGLNKGDARCCYVKPESVQLALNILDGSEFQGSRVSVERAHFEMKGSFDPGKKRRKLSKMEKKKWKEDEEKLLSWTPEDEQQRPSHERIVVIKNVFDAQSLKEDPSQIGEIMVDMQEEAKKFGRVKKVTVYDRNEEGVVTVTYKSPPEADACVAAFNGRWFDKRQLNASNWDGHTKFLVEESEEEMAERLKKWHTYLESCEDSTKDDAAKVENETILSQNTDTSKK